MLLTIYRIDRSLSGKISNFLKKIPDIPVQSAIGNPIKCFSNIITKNCYVMSKEEEINKFKDPRGYSLLNDVYYIRHPKKICTTHLIPANEFYQYILRQQLGDIISYIRANLNIISLKIQIKNSNLLNLGLKDIIEGIPLEGESEVKFSSDFSVEIKCLQKLKASEKKKNFIWIDDFPNVISAVDTAENSFLEIKENFNFNFELSTQIAKTIGINSIWLNTYSLFISVITK